MFTIDFSIDDPDNLAKRKIARVVLNEMKIGILVV